MKILIIASLLLLPCRSAHARIVTLVVGGTNTTASLTVGTNESFSVLAGNGTAVSIVKSGQTFSYPSAHFTESVQSRPSLNRVLMAGPAEVKISGSFPTFVTVEVLPDSFPPDRTLVLPQGTKARIVMESSTNLVHWAEVSPGPFTNNPVNLFFRLRADPVAGNE